MKGVSIDQKLPLLGVGLNLGVLVLLSLFLRPQLTDANLYGLSLGCFMGHLAFLSAWSVWNRRGWFQRVFQINLLFIIGWCLLCAAEILPARDSQARLFLLGLGCFALVFMHTLIDSLSRRRWQLSVRAAFWWTTVFAVLAAISQLIEDGQPHSSSDAMNRMLLLCTSLFLFSGCASFAAVLTLVVYSLKRPVLQKALRLAIVCVAGATLLLLVVSGIGMLTGDYVGNLRRVFMQALSFHVGVVGMLVGCLMLYARRGVSWGPMHGAVTLARGVR